MTRTDARRMIGAARNRSEAVVLWIWCDRGRCPVRHIRVELIDQGEELLRFISDGWLRCPVCGTDRTKLEVARTYDEQRVEDEVACGEMGFVLGGEGA